MGAAILRGVAEKGAVRNRQYAGQCAGAQDGATLAAFGTGRHVFRERAVDDCGGDRWRLAVVEDGATDIAAISGKQAIGYGHHATVVDGAPLAKKAAD